MHPDDLPRPIARARASLEERFGGPAGGVAFAPGLIGLLAEESRPEGRSLRVGLDHGVGVAGRRSPDGVIRLYSNQRGEGFECRPDDLDAGPEEISSEWARSALARVDPAAGPFEAVYAADLPIGWGLGSDEALAAATGLLLGAFEGEVDLSGSDPSSVDLVDRGGSTIESIAFPEEAGLFVVLPTGLPPGPPIGEPVAVPASDFEGAIEALRAGDAVALGRSLQEAYHLPEGPLARLAALARAEPGCLGVFPVGSDLARSMVALVRPENARELRRRVKTAYRRETGLGEGRALVVGPGRSVRLALP